MADVRPFQLSDLNRMEIQPSHAPLRPLVMRNWLVTRPLLENDFSWTLWVDGEPKLAAGIMDDGVGWAFLAADMRGCMVRATREARKILHAFAVLRGPVHADIDTSSPEAVRWAVALGFEPTGDPTRWVIEE